MRDFQNFNYFHFSEIHCKGSENIGNMQGIVVKWLKWFFCEKR